MSSTDGGAGGGIPQGGGGGNDTAEVAKDVVVIFLCGVAVVVGLVLLVYLVALMMDRYCCCCPWFHSLPSAGDQGGQFDHGPVARKAGLWGLKRGERRRILEGILVGKPYQKTNDDDDAPTKNATTARDIETPATRKNPPKATDDQDELEENNLDDAQHETVCAICLSDYVEGELVVSGTSCEHLFHKTCAYEWLVQHDHCPYCRKEMVTPAEMKEKAHEVLGSDRVNEMNMWGVTQELMLRNSTPEDEEEDEEENPDEEDPTMTEIRVELTPVDGGTHRAATTEGTA